MCDLQDLTDEPKPEHHTKKQKATIARYCLLYMWWQKTLSIKFDVCMWSV